MIYYFICANLLNIFLVNNIFRSQGFLNTCVYVYSNRTMMKWLQNNVFCLRLTGKAPRFSLNGGRRSGGGGGEINRESIDRNVESGYEGEAQPAQVIN